MTDVILRNIEWPIGRLTTTRNPNLLIEIQPNDTRLVALEERGDFDNVEDFVETLKSIPISLIPYSNNSVVFMIPNMIVGNRVSYEPIYYDVTNFRNAADVIGALETYYSERPNFNSELKSILLETKEFSENPSSRRIDDILMAPRSLMFMGHHPILREIKMVYPGIYKVIFAF